MRTKVIAELANAALGKLSEPTESAPKMCSILDQIVKAASKTF